MANSLRPQTGTNSTPQCYAADIEGFVQVAIGVYGWYVMGFKRN